MKKIVYCLLAVIAAALIVLSVLFRDQATNEEAIFDNRLSFYPVKGYIAGEKGNPAYLSLFLIDSVGFTKSLGGIIPSGFFITEDSQDIPFTLKEIVSLNSSDSSPYELYKLNITLDTLPDTMCKCTKISWYGKEHSIGSIVFDPIDVNESDKVFWGGYLGPMGSEQYGLILNTEYADFPVTLTDVSVYIDGKIENLIDEPIVIEPGIEFDQLFSLPENLQTNNILCPIYRYEYDGENFVTCAGATSVAYTTLTKLQITHFLEELDKDGEGYRGP